MENQKDSKASPSNGHSTWRRLGWQAALTLVTTVIIVLAVVGFIGFLWFAGINDHFWYKIMITEWATKAVTISTLVLRFAIDLQAGVGAAMLAALVLETSSILLCDAAKVSAMRASNPQPRTSLDIITAIVGSNLRFLSAGSLGYCVAVLLLFATTTVLQFSSTLLLSDLRLGELPDLAVQRNYSIDFVYPTSRDTLMYGPGVMQGFGVTNGGADGFPMLYRTPTWSRNPPAFPAFGEYHEAVSPIDGVDDTGTLFRAFLPMANAQSREEIRNYSGNAFVLDSRMSCQSPKLTRVSIQGELKGTDFKQNDNWPATARMTGSFAPTFHDVEGLWTPGPVPFNCSVFRGKEFFNYYTESGGILSPFWNLTHIRNATTYGARLWQMPILAIKSKPGNETESSSGNTTETYREGYWTNVVTENQTFSVSVCYSSWMTADLHVDLSSSQGRSEPIAGWSKERGFYTIPDIHIQLGEHGNENHSAESRGIMKMSKKDSWIPKINDTIPNQIQPFVQQFAYMDTMMKDDTYYVDNECTDCNALMAYQGGLQTYGHPVGMFIPDYTLTTLFSQALGENGKDSLARAMSSLITVLSSMAYYDQFPRFEKFANSTQVYFTTVLYPQSRFGFWIVMIVLATHTGLIGLIALGFAVFSRHTLLGNHWQSIAQLYGPETQILILNSRESTDKETKEMLRVVGDDDIRIGIRTLDDRRRVGLSVINRRDRSFEDGQSLRE